MSPLNKQIKSSLLLLLLVFFISYNAEAQIKSYNKTAYGISCKLDKGSMNIYLLKDDIVEVKYTNLGKMAPKQSLVVLPVSSYIKNFSVANKGNGIVVTTRKLKIIVNRNTQAIT